MKGTYDAPTATCITMRPTNAETDAAAAIGSANEASIATTASTVHETAARLDLRSMKESTAQPASETKALTAMIWKSGSVLGADEPNLVMSEMPSRCTSTTHATIAASTPLCIAKRRSVRVLRWWWTELVIVVVVIGRFSFGCMRPALHYH